MIEKKHNKICNFTLLKRNVQNIRFFFIIIIKLLHFNC